LEEAVECWDAQDAEESVIKLFGGNLGEMGAERAEEQLVGCWGQEA
jgi:hypothetical protein